MKKSPNRVSNGLCKHWINCYALDWCGLIEQYFRINHRLHGCNGTVPSITWWKASNQWTLTSAQRTILISFRHYVEKCCLKMIKDSIHCQLLNDDIFIVNITVGAVFFFAVVSSSLCQSIKNHFIKYVEIEKWKLNDWVHSNCFASGRVCVWWKEQEICHELSMYQSLWNTITLWQ